MSHVIFIDAECPLCLNTALRIISIDKKNLYKFSPLQGEKACEVLSDRYPVYSELSTLVLVEGYQEKIGMKIWTRGQAAFRVLWLLGGMWKFIGWLCFIPWGINGIYNFIASNRHRMSLKKSLSFNDLPSNRIL